MEIQITADELIAKHLDHCKDTNHLTATYYAHQEALKEAMENMKQSTSSQMMIFWMDVGESIANRLRNPKP